MQITTAATTIDTTRPTDTEVWWRWWAIAAFAHVVGTPTVDGDTARGLANLVVGLVALGVVARPDLRPLRTGLAAAIVVSALVEAPLLGNHWWVAAAISLGLLAARPWQPGDAAFQARFAPTGRLVLLTFYSFAALAKLNTGFLDATASCARFFANQTLSFFHLPEVPGGPGAGTLAWLTLLIEASVPLLLILAPTRRWGVWLAVVFHLALTADLRQHFYDFTLVLVPLFGLFAPPGFLRALDRSLPRPRLGGGRPWLGLAAIQVAAFHLPLGTAAKGLAILSAWALWVGLLAVIARGLVAAWRSGADRPAAGVPPVSFRPVGVAAVVLVAVTALNGLSPYLELKTATGFNMYANLVTAEGESNHLLITRTAGLRAGQGETVTILDADHEGMAEYVDSGFRLPVANLADFLADHPDVSVTYRLADGTVETASGAAPGTVVPRSMPWWEEKFLLFRAVPIDDPPACQNAWLPAR